MAKEKVQKIEERSNVPPCHIPSTEFQIVQHVFCFSVAESPNLRIPFII